LVVLVHRPGEYHEGHRNPYRVSGVLVGRLGWPAVCEPPLLQFPGFL